MEIRGIKSLKIEQLPDNTYKIHVIYTEEFINVLKTVLNKDTVTDEEAIEFIYSALDEI